MTRWQRVAETNPSASPEQKALVGLMVVAEIENAAPRPANERQGTFLTDPGPEARPANILPASGLPDQLR